MKYRNNTDVVLITTLSSVMFTSKKLTKQGPFGFCEGVKLMPTNLF